MNSPYDIIRAVQDSTSRIQAQSSKSTSKPQDEHCGNKCSCRTHIEELQDVMETIVTSFSVTLRGVGDEVQRANKILEEFGVGERFETLSTDLASLRKDVKGIKNMGVENQVERLESFINQLRIKVDALEKRVRKVEEAVKSEVEEPVVD
jgi:archaellum component FlaC